MIIVLKHTLLQWPHEMAAASIDVPMIEFCDEAIERHVLEEADAREVTLAPLMNIVTFN